MRFWSNAFALRRSLGPRGWLTLAGSAMVLWLLVGPLPADTVFRTDGSSVEGRIVEEDEDSVTIDLGGLEMTIQRAQIDRIERGAAIGIVQREARQALDVARRDLEAGRVAAARTQSEVIIRDLENALENLKQESDRAAVVELLQQAEELQRATLPKDPSTERLEKMLAEADRHLDFIQYEQAFEILQEAVRIDPRRADIQFQLGELAQRLNNQPVAVEAYTAAIDLNPEAYYRDVAGPLLELLKGQGQRLVGQRRSDEAMAVYREVLLLESEEGGAVDLSEFLARQTTREAQKEDEVLMEVYRYADDNDLIDLAFVAIRRVQQLKPDDQEVARLAQKAEFLSTLKASLDVGDTDRAAELLADAPAELLESGDVNERIDALAGELREELEIREKLERAQAALDAASFGEAARLARELTTDYPQSEEASTALEILEEAEFEAPIQEALEASTAAVSEQRYDAAVEILESLIQGVDITESRFRNDIQSLVDRVPREREADRLWDLARTHLEGNEFDEALERLEQLSSEYSGTISGGRAAQWLADYRARLEREARHTQLFDTGSIFNFANPALWRAAALPRLTNDQLRIPEVEGDEAREAAWASFEELNVIDARKDQQARSLALYLGVPLTAGGLLLLGLVLAFARPGKGKCRSVNAVRRDPTTATGDITLDASSGECRMCGAPVAEDVFSCPTCGAAIQLSELEAERADAMERMADYDPWDIRVKAGTANDFHKHFQAAKDLAETSDVQAAMEACRKALHEDPMQKEGYYLLAELYERLGKGEEAAKCYREILLISPAEVVVRQKVESLLNLVNQPLRMNGVILTMSIAVWWLIFWLSVGLDPLAWGMRLLLAVFGCILTVIALRSYQGRNRMGIEATNRAELDVHRPLAHARLSWAEQNKQASMLADAIRDHTGVEVPVLTVWRLLAALLLSLLLLAVMGLIAFVNGTWWVFIGWPAGVLVFFYLFEIHPRVLTAYIVLRHIFEETTSPWVDPHRPFRPRDLNVAGEFLIRRFDEWPLRWALRPFPYSNDRQGMLNSLQQTLNRHWACHRFYEGLHTVRDVDVPFPAGAKSLTTFSGLILVAAVLAVSGIMWTTTEREGAFDDSMRLGYLAMLDGHVDRAREELARAAILKPHRTLPHLYLAHINAAASYDPAAERSFARAARFADDLPVVHNDFANFLQRKGRPRAAIREYLQAVEDDPENADILSNMGSAYYKLGEYEKAAGRLREAVRINPQHSRAYTTLGLALEEMGDWPGAREAYENAVAMAPDLPYTQLARDRLEAGGEDSSEPLSLEVTMAN